MSSASAAPLTALLTTSLAALASALFVACLV